MCPLDVPLILLKGYPLLGEDMYIYIHIIIIGEHIPINIYVYIHISSPSSGYLIGKMKNHLQQIQVSCKHNIVTLTKVSPVTPNSRRKANSAISPLALIVLGA